MKKYDFKIKNECAKHLNLIFENINNSNYIWYLEDEEIFKIMDFYLIKIA